MPLQTAHAVQEAVRTAPKPTSMDAVKQGLELPPDLLALLGAGADAASTYGFMKQPQQSKTLRPKAEFRRTPTQSEDNTLFAGHGPAATALGVLGSSLGTLALEKLLHHKAPGISNALMANQGAQSLGLAAENVSPNNDSSVNTLNNKITSAVRRKK